MDKYKTKRQNGYVFYERETQEQFYERQAQIQRFKEEIDKEYKKKNPPVDFALHTTNEKVIAIYNKLFYGFKIKESKFKADYGYRTN